MPQSRSLVEPERGKTWVEPKRKRVFCQCRQAIIGLAEVLIHSNRIEDCLNPVWVRPLFIDNEGCAFVPIKISIYDENEKKGDKLVGEANFILSEIYDSAENSQFEKLKGGCM